MALAGAHALTASRVRVADTPMFEEVDRLSEVGSEDEYEEDEYVEQRSEHEFEMHEEPYAPPGVSAREQSRRDAFREAGSRGWRRHRAERKEPYADVVVGYLAELYTSPRFETVRRGTSV